MNACQTTISHHPSHTVLESRETDSGRNLSSSCLGLSTAALYCCSLLQLAWSYLLSITSWYLILCCSLLLLSTAVLVSQFVGSTSELSAEQNPAVEIRQSMIDLGPIIHGHRNLRTLQQTYTEQMDTESLQDDLVSLRKLYRLLQINKSGDGSQSSEALDDGSCRLLKRLLDSATENLFENHLKILASSWRSLISVPGSRQLEAAKQVQSSRPPVSPYSCNIQKDNKIDPLASKALEEDDPTSSMFRRDNTHSSTILAPTNFPTESQNPRKRCLACERKGSRKDLSTMSLGYAPHEKNPTPGRGLVKVCSSSTVAPGIEKQMTHLRGQLGSGSKSSRDMAVMGKQNSSHTHGFFSREVDDAVKRIESLIPSLQRLTRRQPSPPAGETGSSNQDFHSFSGSTNSLNGISVYHSTAQQGLQVQDDDFLEPADQKQIPRVGRFSEQKAKHAWDKRMSASHLDDIQKKARVMKNWEPRSALSPPLSSERFTDPRKRTDAGNFFSNNLDGDPRIEPKDSLTPYNKNYFQRVHGKRSPRSKSSWATQKEPESSSYSTSNSRASSWTTTATSLTSASWTEEAQSTTWFSTDGSQQGFSDNRRLNAGSGGSSSEFSASYPYNSLDSDDVSDDGHHGNEVVPSPPRHHADLLKSKHTWSNHYRDQVNHEGHLKRLKNKLGLILHQHRRPRREVGKYNDGHHNKIVKEPNVKSLWKQLGKKIFKHVEDEKRYDNKFPTTKRKAKSNKGQDKNVIAGRKSVVTRKQQDGQFHSLVNGLISHMRRTKKAKAAVKDGMVGKVKGRGGMPIKKNLIRRNVGGKKGKGGIGVPALAKKKLKGKKTSKWPQLKPAK